MILAVCGLGSNLGDREKYIETAIRALVAMPALQLGRRSHLYETEPVGLREQPLFLNAVCELFTELSAVELLDCFLSVEKMLGRTRRKRWGPRIIDLDLLLYGGEKISTKRLSVPHPRLGERRFVLEPLAELLPDYRLPGTAATVLDLLHTCEDRSAVRKYTPTTINWEVWTRNC